MYKVYYSFAKKSESLKVIKTRSLFDADGDWRVFVTTGSQDNCGTDAQVALTVFGEKGDTDKLPLGAPEQGLFENGSTDQFDVCIFSLVRYNSTNYAHE